MSESTLTPEARQYAEANKRHMIQIVIDAKYCEPQGGRIVISGPCPPELAKKLYELINEISAHPEF